VKPLCS